MLYFGEAFAEMVQNIFTDFTKDKKKMSLFSSERQEFFLEHF